MKMNAPRVSILLPTYNRADILPGCMQKVLEQEYREYELLVLDDCSDDATQQVVEKFSQQHQNIRYYRNHVRTGTPLTRNRGIELAKGELIFFIEDDLLLDSHCVSGLVTRYDELRTTERIGGIAPRLIDDRLKMKEFRDQPFILNRFTGDIINNYAIVSEDVIPAITLHACSLYPKDVLGEVGGYSGVFRGNYFREETDLNFRIARKGYRLIYDPRAFAYHLRHPTGSYRNLSPLQVSCYSIRNHALFVIRIFSYRAVYMIPLYCMAFFVGTWLGSTRDVPLDTDAT